MSYYNRKSKLLYETVIFLKISGDSSYTLGQETIYPLIVIKLFKISSEPD